MIYSINMHTTVYQFWRFVYHPEQSVIDHYDTKFIIYAIILYGDQIVRRSFFMAPELESFMWLYALWKFNFSDKSPRPCPYG